jgi:SAM-dependent methyltransferase
MNNNLNHNPLSDIVSSQYEQWVYPKPILDLRNWLEHNWQWFDPSHANRIFWPNKSYKPDLDILIAGCGTNQAAVFAYNNPDAKIVAIDVSRPSLDHHQYLKDKYVLKNLELHLLPIEGIGSLGLDFDLIVSTGVLHHLADPKVGLQALAHCLRQDGVIALMLYAKFGRIGVEILQSVARDLRLQQSDACLHIVKDMLSVLPQNHPIKSYLSIAPDLQFDAGLVDTFLHGRDKSYSVDECIDLVTSSGLVFQDMFMKSPYYPVPNTSNAFYSSISKLTDPKQWAIMERINFNNGCHFFTACRPDRPPQTYKIDFSSDASLQYIASLRYRCELNGQTLSRYNWNTALNETELPFVRAIDGQNTIADIIKEAAKANVFATHTPKELQTMGKSLLQRLWQLDMLTMSWS